MDDRMVTEIPATLLATEAIANCSRRSGTEGATANKALLVTAGEQERHPGSRPRPVVAAAVGSVQTPEASGAGYPEILDFGRFDIC